MNHTVFCGDHVTGGNVRNIFLELCAFQFVFALIKKEPLSRRDLEMKKKTLNLKINDLIFTKLKKFCLSFINFFL